jgi:hypothetical protein
MRLEINDEVSFFWCFATILDSFVEKFKGRMENTPKLQCRAFGNVRFGDFVEVFVAVAEWAFVKGFELGVGVGHLVEKIINCIFYTYL